MAEICEKFALPARINVLKFQNDKTDELIGVCTEFEKNAKPPAPTAHRGLQHSATTCCPRYPSGSTVLECRLEGDQPVAHVVQVPADGNTATQKMCLILETKQSPSGPLSRIISRDLEDCPEECANGTCKSTASPGTTYCLESQTYPGGATAVASTVPTDSSNLVTALETTKADEDGNRPYSKILYGPAGERIAEASSCEANSRDPAVTFIDCTASRKGTLARVTKCFDEIASPEKTYYETNVEDGDPTAVSYQRPTLNDGVSCRQDILETRVDKHGPRTRLIDHPTDCKRYCGYMESRSSCEGPSARITQTPAESLYEQRCLATVAAAARDDAKKRRNGLDPYENKNTVSIKTRLSCLRPARFPGLCSSPENPRSESSSDHRNYTDSIRCEPIKSVTPQEAAEAPVEEQCKTKELVDCDSSKARSKPGCVALEETSDCAGDHVTRIEPQELLTCYRDYVPSTLLDRYEACRSKRNGLQDQCFLPVPRAVIELKKKNEAISRISDRRDIRNNADCQSVGNGRALATPLASVDSSGLFGNATVSTENTKPAPIPEPKTKTKPPKKSGPKDKKAEPTRAKRIRVRRVKSRELYSGSVYIDCDCYHRNGLQHDCPRTSCGGRPPCLAKPWPECDLGVYFMDKWEKYYDHLDTIPPTSFCGPREAWQAVLEEEKRKRAGDKCREELLPQNNETGDGKQPAKIVHSKKLEDTVRACSGRPDGIAEEYVMIPIKVNSKESQCVKNDKSPGFCDSKCSKSVKTER